MTPSMPAKIIGPIVLLAAAATVAASSLIPDEPPMSDPVTVVPTVAITCPFLGKSSSLFVGADSKDIAWRPLSAETAEMVSPTKGQAMSEPVEIYAERQAVGGVLRADGDDRSWVNCTVPSASQFLAVDDPSTSELVLVNPDSSAAIVDISLTGPNGRLRGAGLRGITLSGNSSRIVPLSVVTDEQAVGIRVEASEGRVLAMSQALEGEPATYTLGSPASGSHLIPGLPEKASAHSLYLTNPGESRITYQVEALTPVGSVVLAGFREVTIAEQTTQKVDLTKAVAGEAVALRITSDGPLGAHVVSERDDGLTSLASTAGGASTQLVAPDSGSLEISNPSIDSVSASVQLPGADQPRSITVPAGGTQTIAVSKTGRVSVEAEQPLVGALVLDGKGLGIVPLEGWSTKSDTIQLDYRPGYSDLPALDTP